MILKTIPQQSSKYYKTVSKYKPQCPSNKVANCKNIKWYNIQIQIKKNCNYPTRGNFVVVTAGSSNEEYIKLKRAIQQQTQHHQQKSQLGYDEHHN